MGKTLLATLKEKEQYLGDFLDTNFKMAKVVNGFSTKQSFVYKQDILYLYIYSGNPLPKHTVCKKL